MPELRAVHALACLPRVPSCPDSHPCPPPAGARDKQVVKCPCCESQLEFDATESKVTVTELAS